MLDPVSAASIPKAFERRSEGALAASVDGKRSHAVPGRSHVGMQPTYGWRLLWTRCHRRAGHPKMDVAAIHARWQAEERATLAAVDRKVGIDNESDT